MHNTQLEDIDPGLRKLAKISVARTAARGAWQFLGDEVTRLHSVVNEQREHVERIVRELARYAANHDARPSTERDLAQQRHALAVYSELLAAAQKEQAEQGARAESHSQAIDKVAKAIADAQVETADVLEQFR